MSVLTNPDIQGIGLATERSPQPLAVQLPERTVVVSADSHISLGENIFVERFPHRLRDRAPQIWYDEASGAYEIGFDGKSVVPPAAREFIDSHESRPGAHDIAHRLHDMDVEGVDKEIAFPQLISFMHYHPDFEARELCFRVYNQYLADLQTRAPERLYGVGIFLRVPLILASAFRRRALRGSPRGRG
jgi:hypothetical protein